MNNMFVLSFFEGKLIFWDLAGQVEQHNHFHLCPGRKPILNVYSRVFVDIHVSSGVPRSTVWLLMLLRWCCVSGLVPLGAAILQLAYTVSMLDTTNLSTLLTFAHTPPLRIKGVQTPSVLRDIYPPLTLRPSTQQHTLLILSKVRFSSHRFPQLIFFDELSSQVDGLLTWTTTTMKHFLWPSVNVCVNWSTQLPLNHHHCMPNSTFLLPTVWNTWQLPWANFPYIAINPCCL